LILAYNAVVCYQLKIHSMLLYAEVAPEIDQVDRLSRSFEGGVESS